MAKKSELIALSSVPDPFGTPLLFVCYNGVVIIQLGSLVQYAFAVASVMPGKPLSTFETVLRIDVSFFAINAWVGLVTVRLIAAVSILSPNLKTLTVCFVPQNEAEPRHNWQKTLIH